MQTSVKYSSQNNINVYENGVLKNKFNVHDEKRLKKLEEGIVLSMITSIFNDGIEGNFDIEHLKRIHKYLFSNIYYFAGNIRSENIIKGETLFCQFHLIEKELENLFLNLKREKFENENEISSKIAYYYSELNIIHPFREGNGRTSRIFFKLFLRNMGYDIIFDKVKSDQLLTATIDSVSKSSKGLEQIFKGIIIKSNH